jgi:hypothetical protein
VASPSGGIGHEAARVDRLSVTLARIAALTVARIWA